MMDLIKKSMLAGIGAAVVTKEMAQKTLDEWVEKGKVSSDEAKEMANKIVEQGREEYDKARSDLGKMFDEAMARAHVVTRRELAALEARVAALEAEQQSETKGEPKA